MFAEILALCMETNSCTNGSSMIELKSNFLNSNGSAFPEHICTTCFLLCSILATTQSTLYISIDFIAFSSRSDSSVSSLKLTIIALGNQKCLMTPRAFGTLESSIEILDESLD